MSHIIEALTKLNTALGICQTKDAAELDKYSGTPVQADIKHVNGQEKVISSVIEFAGDAQIETSYTLTGILRKILNDLGIDDSRLWRRSVGSDKYARDIYFEVPKDREIDFVSAIEVETRRIERARIKEHFRATIGLCLGDVYKIDGIEPVISVEFPLKEDIYKSAPDPFIKLKLYGVPDDLAKTLAKTTGQDFNALESPEEETRSRDRTRSFHGGKIIEIVMSNREVTHTAINDIGSYSKHGKGLSEVQPQQKKMLSLMRNMVAHLGIQDMSIKLVAEDNNLCEIRVPMQSYTNTADSVRALFNLLGPLAEKYQVSMYKQHNPKTPEKGSAVIVSVDAGEEFFQAVKALTADEVSSQKTKAQYDAFYAEQEQKRTRVRPQQFPRGL